MGCVIRYTASDGNSLAVFDGFLDDGDLKKLRHYMLHGSFYQYEESDGTGTDNVKWIAGTYAGCCAFVLIVMGKCSTCVPPDK